MGPDLSDQQALFGVPWSNEFDPTGEAAARRVGATSVAHRELIAGMPFTGVRGRLKSPLRGEASGAVVGSNSFDLSALSEAHCVTQIQHEHGLAAYIATKG